MLAGKAQVGGQCLLVIEQAAHRGRVRLVVAGGEGLDALLGKGFRLVGRVSAGMSKMAQ